MPLFQLTDIKKSVEQTILFIHIPKTGGTSVEMFFEGIGFATYLAPKDYAFVRPYLKVPPTHFDMSLIDAMFDLKNNSLYSFAVVRHPADRMISSYMWAKEKSKLQHIGEQLASYQKMNLEEFIALVFEEYSNDNNYMSNHIKPQHMFVSDSVTKVFHLENGLDNAIKEVLTDNGVTLNGELKMPQENKSNPYQTSISQQAKEMIYEFYKDDFTKFDYKP